MKLNELKPAKNQRALGSELDVAKVQVGVKLVVAVTKDKNPGLGFPFPLGLKGDRCH